MVVVVLPFAFPAAAVVRLILWCSTRRMVNQRLLVVVAVFVCVQMAQIQITRIVKLFGLGKQLFVRACVCVWEHA